MREGGESERGKEKERERCKAAKKVLKRNETNDMAQVRRKEDY